jgi:hypothetical protein
LLSSSSGKIRHQLWWAHQVEIMPGGCDQHHVMSPAQHVSYFYMMAEAEPTSETLGYLTKTKQRKMSTIRVGLYFSFITHLHHNILWSGGTF